MKPLVIFIMGKAQSGKDTLAKIMIEKIQSGYKNHSFDVINMAFADALKDICRRNHNYEDKLEDRDILIEIGDDMRSIDQDVFVKPVAQFLEIYHKLGYNVFIITDMRYQNEYYSLVSMLNVLPFVIKVQSIYEHKNITAFAKSHPTENIEFSPDYSIILKPINNNSILEIEEEVGNIIYEILDKYLDETF